MGFQQKKFADTITEVNNKKLYNDSFYIHDLPFLLFKAAFKIRNHCCCSSKE